MSTTIDRDALTAAGFALCEPRAAGEPIANYQSRLAAFIIRERTIATLSDDELAQGDIGLMRAICGLPATLADVDLKVIGMLSDLRHWISTTQRARATGIVPMMIPELPKDTQPAGGRTTELQPAPKVDPHGPNGAHVVPVLMRDMSPGDAWRAARDTFDRLDKQPAARATSSQPAPVEW